MPSCKALAPDEVGPVTFFTLVHAAFGFLAGYISARRPEPYAWVVVFILGHVMFEIWESTQSGIEFFNSPCWKTVRKHFRQLTRTDLWCNYTGDSSINSGFDTITFGLGAMFGVYYFSDRRS